MTADRFTTAATPGDLAAVYFEAWRAKDPSLLRPALADDVQFEGPLAQVSGADAYCDSIAGLYAITTEIVIHKVLADETDAMTWFDLHTSVAPAVPVANWCHAPAGKIERVRVAFDPRGLLAPQGP